MSRITSAFWSRWIDFLSLVLIIYGVAMIFAPQFMNSTMIGPMFYAGGPLEPAFRSVGGPNLTFINVLSGLLGAVTIGWAVQIGWIAYKPFHKGETWAWNALAISATLWAFLEFYVKLKNGITGIGLYANFGLLVAFYIPLALTYRQFHPLK